MNSIFFCCCCFVFVCTRSFHLVKSSAILVIGGHNSVQNLRRKGWSLSQKNKKKLTTGIEHSLKCMQATKTNLSVSKASFGNMPDIWNIRWSVVSGLDQSVQVTKVSLLSRAHTSPASLFKYFAMPNSSSTEQTYNRKLTVYHTNSRLVQKAETLYFKQPYS